MKYLKKNLLKEIKYVNSHHWKRWFANHFPGSQLHISVQSYLILKLINSLILKIIPMKKLSEKNKKIKQINNIFNGHKYVKKVNKKVQKNA